MSLRSAVLKGTALVAIGQVAAQALTLGRSMIVARLISQEDVGIGSTLMLVILLFEMISNVRPGMLILQADDGDEPALSGSVHTLELARGIVIAVLTLLIARPAAVWFGVPEATWAFQVVGIVPILTGLLHQDMIRVQRKFSYGPSLWVDLVPHAVAAALAWPLATWLGDYTAILWLIVVRATLATLISQIVARRPYRLNFDRTRMRQIMAFGWPLLANGLLMFGIVQGDRLIIGSRYTSFTLADLGLYAMAWNVTAAISQVMARTTSPLIPLFSQERKDPVLLARHYGLSCQLAAALGAVVGVVFMLLGGLVMTWLYGASYGAAGTFIGWLAAASAVRTMRLIPGSAALAFADTRNLMLANLVRSASLIGAVAVAVLGWGLEWIAIAGFAGEILALGAIVVRLRRVTGIRASLCLLPMAFLGAWLAAAWAARPVIAEERPVAACLLCIAVVATMLAGGAVLSPELRRQLSRSLQRRVV